MIPLPVIAGGVALWALLRPRREAGKASHVPASSPGGGGGDPKGSKPVGASEGAAATPAGSPLPAAGVPAAGVPAAGVTDEQARQAAMWAIAHETNPKNLEAFARALIELGQDPDAAHALLLKAVQLSDPSAGKV